MPTPEHQFARPPWPYDLHATRPVPDLRLLPQDEADRARTRLAELDRACGCTLGAIVALISLAVYVGLVLGLGLMAGGTWATVGTGAGVFAIAGGAGKTLGLMRARTERDRLLDELHSRVAAVSELG